MREEQGGVGKVVQRKSSAGEGALVQVRMIPAALGRLVLVQDGFPGVVMSVLLGFVLWIESQHVISRKNPLAFLSWGISVLLHGSEFPRNVSLLLWSV